MPCWERQQKSRRKRTTTVVWTTSGTCDIHGHLHPLAASVIFDSSCHR